MKLFKLLLLVLLLSSCATKSFAPMINDADATTVYFIRERAEPTAWNVSIYLDKKKYASVSNHSYVQFKAPSGEHDFSIDWPALAGQLDLDGRLTLEPHKTAYYLISADYEMLGMYGNAIRYKTTVGLVPISESDALKLMKGMNPK